MNFTDFHKRFFEPGCFNIRQVQAWCDGNTLARWTRQKRLLRLRTGLYTFSEYLNHPNFTLHVSNYIYKPSYVSLYTALAFYDIIPETVAEVAEVTAVSTLKTAAFDNAFGSFTYRTLEPELMFGYNILTLGNRNIRLAQPEKAILDLLYLYPFLDSNSDSNFDSEIENLRFNGHYMYRELDVDKLLSYLNKFDSPELSNRVEILMKIHDIRTDWKQCDPHD